MLICCLFCFFPTVLPEWIYWYTFLWNIVAIVLRPFWVPQCLCFHPTRLPSRISSIYCTSVLFLGLWRLFTLGKPIKKSDTEPAKLRTIILLWISCFYWAKQPLLVPSRSHCDLLFSGISFCTHTKWMGYCWEALDWSILMYCKSKQVTLGKLSQILKPGKLYPTMNEDVASM